MSKRGRLPGCPRSKGYVAVGSIDKRRPERKQIAISFDAEQFDEIAQTAARRGMSFAALVQLYCEWGVENDETEKTKAA